MLLARPGVQDNDKGDGSRPEIGTVVKGDHLSSERQAGGGSEVRDVAALPSPFEELARERSTERSQVSPEREALLVRK